MAKNNTKHRSILVILFLRNIGKLLKYTFESIVIIITCNYCEQKVPSKSVQRRTAVAMAILNSICFIQFLYQTKILLKSRYIY